MPMIRYTCTNDGCNHSFSFFIRDVSKIPNTTPCKKCEKDAKRSLSFPSNSSKIVIDNGQARAVEVDPNIMDQRKERSDKLPDRGD